MLKLLKLVKHRLFTKAHRKKQTAHPIRDSRMASETKREPVTVKKAAQQSADAVPKLDPYDMSKCDTCVERKKSVRARRMVRIGRSSGTVRWKFCDECVAIAGLQTMPEPPADADFLIYYDGERANVLVRPQNPAARYYLQTILKQKDGVESAVSAEAQRTPRWIVGAFVIRAGSVVSLAHRLLSAGFKVVGDKEFIETPRLYVHEGKYCVYTAGREIPNEVLGQIVTGSGKPN